MLPSTSPRVVLKRLHFNENIVFNFLQEVENKSSATLKPEQVEITKMSKREGPRVVLERMRFDENMQPDNGECSITPKPDIVVKEEVQTAEMKKNKVPVVILERMKFEDNMIIDLLDDDDVEKSTTRKSETMRKQEVQISKPSKRRIPIVVLERMDMNKNVEISLGAEENKNEIELAKSKTPGVVLKRNFEENDKLCVKKKKKIKSPSKKVPLVVLQRFDYKETSVARLPEVEIENTVEPLVTLTEKCDEALNYVVEIVEEPHLIFCKTCSVFHSNAEDHLAASPDCKEKANIETIDLTSNELRDLDENVNIVDLDHLSEFRENSGTIPDTQHSVDDDLQFVHLPANEGHPVNDNVQIVDDNLDSLPKDDSLLQVVDLTSPELHPEEDDVEIIELDSLSEDGSSSLQTYICEVCNVSFQRRYEIKEHLRGHALFITLCDRRRKLFRPVQGNPEPIYLPFSCTKCSKSFSCLKYLNRHKEIHSEEKSCSCQACNTDLNIQQLNTTLYQCKLCNTSLSCLKLLKIHKDDHLTKKPFHCNQCNKSYVKEISLFNHVCRNENFCELCDESFMRRIELMQHYRDAHLDAKLYSCDQCDKTFACSAYLKNHKAVHLEKTIPCGLCNKLFSCSRYLRNHMVTHAKKNNLPNIINNNFKAIFNPEAGHLDNSIVVTIV